MLGPSLAARESLRAWGSRYARLIFEQCGRNKRAAARYLDISYHTLEEYLGYGYASSQTGSRIPEWARLHALNRTREATVVTDAARTPDDDAAPGPPLERAPQSGTRSF